MIISFDISNAKLTRLGDALESFGYVFNPDSPKTDAQQKLDYLKVVTKQQWASIIYNHERKAAVEAAKAALIEAENSTPFPDISDIV